jgi:hypothetical protein
MRTFNSLSRAIILALVFYEAAGATAAPAAQRIHRTLSVGSLARDGRQQVLIDLLLGAQNRDFDGVEAIWSFLRDKRR